MSDRPGVDLMGRPLPVRVSSYTPVCFQGGKKLVGAAQSSLEEAQAILQAWETNYGIKDPMAVEVTTTIQTQLNL